MRKSQSLQFQCAFVNIIDLPIFNRLNIKIINVMYEDAYQL